MAFWNSGNCNPQNRQKAKIIPVITIDDDDDGHVEPQPQQQEPEIDSISASTLEKQLKDLQTNCFNALVQKVIEMAKEHNVSAGTVLLKSKSTLSALSLRMPETREDFLKTPGVTYTHFERYGAPLLKICVNFALQKYGLALDSPLNSGDLVKLKVYDGSSVLDIRKQCFDALLEKREGISKDHNVTVGSIMSVQTVRALSFYLPETQEDFIKYANCTESKFWTYKFKTSLLQICIGYAAQKVLIMDDQPDTWDKQGGSKNSIAHATPRPAKRTIYGMGIGTYLSAMIASTTWSWNYSSNFYAGGIWPTPSRPSVGAYKQNKVNTPRPSVVPPPKRIKLSEKDMKAQYLEIKTEKLQNQCFLALVNKVEEIATNQKTHVGNILTVQSIRALSVEMPESRYQFINSTGIAEAKYEKYGTQFLNICIGFAAQKLMIEEDQEDFLS